MMENTEPSAAERPSCPRCGDMHLCEPATAATPDADDEGKAAELDAIEARANAAPEGPWRTFANPMRSDGLFVAQDRPRRMLDGYLAGPRLEATPSGAWGLHAQVEPAAAEFIAHARADIPALVAEVRRLRATREAGTNNEETQCR